MSNWIRLKSMQTVHKTKQNKTMDLLGESGSSSPCRPSWGATPGREICRSGAWQDRGLCWRSAKVRWAVLDGKWKTNFSFVILKQAGEWTKNTKGNKTSKHHSQLYFWRAPPLMRTGIASVVATFQELWREGAALPSTRQTEAASIFIQSTTSLCAATLLLTGSTAAPWGNCVQSLPVSQHFLPRHSWVRTTGE